MATRHLEGSLIVELKDGTNHMLTTTPFGGNVYHRPVDGGAFSEVTVTDEEEFRGLIKRVVSRSRYDRR